MRQTWKDNYNNIQASSNRDNGDVQKKNDLKNDHKANRILVDAAKHVQKGPSDHQPSEVLRHYSCLQCGIASIVVKHHCPLTQVVADLPVASFVATTKSSGGKMGERRLPAFLVFRAKKRLMHCWPAVGS
jgi:hypothetical protein